jgi:peptidoglycan/LPS O-acetylase OafA/YrhL/GT2 family glycosyltransferase
VTGERRLAGVDGLRAAAALWVVLFHIRAFSGARLSVVPGLDLLARSGSTGVSLFLVLSGFCLFLPFAGGRAGRFHTRRFLVRRCRRLLPAYYASLVASTVLLVTANGRLGLPAFDTAAISGQVAAHLTMTHSLLPSTFYGLNGAYWSLALEWQLYLALPLLIVGVRRFGVARTVTAAIAVNVVYRLALGVAVDHRLVEPAGSLASAVLPNLLPGRWAEFALGMVAAELYATHRLDGVAHRLPYALPVLIPVGFLATGAPLDHVIFGGVFFTLLSVVLAGGNPVARAFSWSPLATLGTMSYSLYLVHQPMVQVLANVLGAGHGASSGRVFLELVLCLPLSLLAAWVLFVTVERHSLSVPRPVDGVPVSPPMHSASRPTETPVVGDLGDAPTVSVVIPTHRRLRSLLRVLDALEVQDYPHDLLDVIVVADGDLPTAEALRGRPGLQVLTQAHSGPGAARNAGIERARGELVLFLDDDVVPAPGCVRRHAEAHTDRADLVVIGPLLPSRGGIWDSPWVRWEARTLQRQYSDMQAGRWSATARQFYTGNASVRREHLVRLGGFNVALRRAEDVELGLRLRDLGVVFEFRLEATAHHEASRRYRSWVSAAREYGRVDAIMGTRMGRPEVLDWAAREFHGRRTLTRIAVLHGGRHPWLPAVLPWLVAPIAWAALWCRIGRVSDALCGGVFNLLYWDAVSDHLGRPAAEALIASHAPSPR